MPCQSARLFGHKVIQTAISTTLQYFKVQVNCFMGNCKWKPGWIKRRKVVDGTIKHTNMYKYYEKDCCMLD